MFHNKHAEKAELSLEVFNLFYFCCFPRKTKATLINAKKVGELI